MKKTSKVGKIYQSENVGTMEIISQYDLYFMDIFFSL